MTSKLPFGLTTKPTRRYIHAHSLTFRESNGKLFCLIRVTTKNRKNPFSEFEVKTKDMVNRLKKADTLDELKQCYADRHLIEVVSQ